MSVILLSDITGLVLAGGQGRRMGGRDKGLLVVQGRPLAAWTLARLAGQTGTQAISANRHLDAYRRLGVPVWTDGAATHAPVTAGHDGMSNGQPDFSGPLAGMAAGLARGTTPYLAVVPCDSPCFPADLVQRLAQALRSAQADVALAATAQAGQGAQQAQAQETLRPQPVFCLLRTVLLPDLQYFLKSGGRRVLDWMQQCRHVQVRFDDAQAFAGANTPQELAALQGRLKS